MQRLPIHRNSPQNLAYPTPLQIRAGEETLKLQLSRIDVLQPLVRRGRDGFQSPFFERYAPEQVVAVFRDLLLPPRLGFFPARPGFARFVDDSVREREFAAWWEGVRDAFAEDERAARGDWEEEEAHRGRSWMY